MQSLCPTFYMGAGDLNSVPDAVCQVFYELIPQPTVRLEARITRYIQISTDRETRDKIIPYVSKDTRLVNSSPPKAPLPSCLVHEMQSFWQGSVYCH